MNQQQTEVQPAASRPSGVTLIVALLLIGGIWNLFRGIILTIALFEVGNVTGLSTQKIALNLLFYLGLGAFAVIISIGLLKLKKWAYSCYFVLGFISLIAAITAIYINRINAHLVLTYFNLLIIIIVFALMYYLYKNRAVFR